MAKDNNTSCRAFTIIEILIVVTLIALVAGIVGINVRKALQEQKYLNEVHLIHGQLQKAQDLMQLMNVYMLVKFSKDDAGNYSSWLEAKSPTTRSIQNMIDQTYQSYQTIQRLEFQDRYTDTVLYDDFEITFASKGFIINRGEFRIYGKNGDQQPKLIYLPGYSSPLIIVNQATFEPPDPTYEYESYDALTRLTGQETQIPEDEKSTPKEKSEHP